MQHLEGGWGGTSKRCINVKQPCAGASRPTKEAIWEKACRKCRFESDGTRGRRLWQRANQHEPNVLDRGNEVILNLLPPQATPAGAFETVVVGCIGKTAFC